MREKEVVISSIKVSYLIAVRNKASTIGRCLSSILTQDVDEIVVVDGRSTDGTSELVDKVPVVHLYDTQTGPASARNIGSKRCTGKYIVILDGDQWIPDGFDRKLKTILNSKQWDVIFCKEVWKGSSIWAKAHQEAWIQASTLRYNRLYRPRVLRRSVIYLVGGWDERFTSFEDADLWNRIKRLSPTICKPDLTIYSDASDMSVASQFRRGLWYGSKLLRFVRRYPSQWEHFTSVAPVDFIVNLLLATKILVATRDIRLSLAAFILRLAGSTGWLIGVLLSK